MDKRLIKQLIQQNISEDGIVETGIKGVKLFRVTEPIRCAPAVYEPSIVAIVSGAKEAILDGKQHVYDSSQYMCCAISMPVEAGSPAASLDNPLLGVYIALDPRVMTELVIEIESSGLDIRKPKGGRIPQGVTLADWDAPFNEALLRLIQISNSPSEAALLGDGRLRELYYTVLKGAAGESVSRAFGVGNEIARSIAYLSSRLDQKVSIEEMASQVGMSRAVFHRKFKQATTMSPVQFVKCMRLNSAAIKIAAGMTVNQAAMEVGYVSSTQFSREFRRLYGLPPKQWGRFEQSGTGLM